MAKKYCKKSSMQAVADEVKVRLGASEYYTIQGSYMATEISNLEKPVNRGSPSVTLTASSPSYTAQEGKYTGGSVSVVPKNATATLSQNGGYVPIESGKTLASVKVPARNAYSFDDNKSYPSDYATSISITGIKFDNPTNIVIINTNTGNIYDNAVVSVYAKKNGEVGGVFAGKSGYLGSVTSANVSFGTNSVTISNIVGIRNGATISGIFRNKEYCWFAWG